MKKIKINHYRVIAGATKSQVRKEIKRCEKALTEEATLPADLKCIKSIKEVKDNKLPLHPYGGLTVAELVEGTATTLGLAVCGMKENFRRKQGRKVAEGRLQKMLQ